MDKGPSIRNQFAAEISDNNPHTKESILISNLKTKTMTIIENNNQLQIKQNKER
jgi:hypothetical protein